MSAYILEFGKAGDTLEILQRRYPQLSFHTLKQVHSDSVVEASASGMASGRENGIVPETEIEADAHFTFRKKEALCIRTADCVPILIYVDKAVAAIHAGWRGIDSNIISKTVSALKVRGCDPALMQAWIGPHIGPASFEVGTEVAGKLRAAFLNLPKRVAVNEVIFPHPDPQKNFVNLERMANAQLMSAGVALQNIRSDFADTFVCRDYHSYRRDHKLAGRQISFIALL